MLILEALDYAPVVRKQLKTMTCFAVFDEDIVHSLDKELIIEIVCSSDKELVQTNAVLSLDEDIVRRLG